MELFRSVVDRDESLQRCQRKHHRSGATAFLDIGLRFGLPQSKIDDIRKNYESPIQRKEAFLKAYTHSSPCPTWGRVVEVLRSCRGLDQQVALVENTYIQGMFKCLGLGLG